MLQCVAGIACAEIPADKWPELIDQLVKNVSELGERTPEAYDNIKEASLEAIGYICQDIVSTTTALHINSEVFGYICIVSTTWLCINRSSLVTVL